MLEKLTVAAAFFALAGCAGSMTTTTPMDAAVVHSSSGADVHTRYAGDPATGRNWNCACPMCNNPKSMKSGCYH